MQYKFTFWGGENNSYLFETDFSIVYEIKFKASDYLFFSLDESISKNVFEFVIDRAHNPNKKKTPLDPKIGVTISTIFNDFFTRNSETIAIYICEAVDQKQNLRMKKFDTWFRKFEDASYLKLDEILVDSHQNHYPISIILKNTNPNRGHILEAFINIAKIQNQK